MCLCLLGSSFWQVPFLELLTGSKAGGWGGKAKVAVAAGSGTVVPACGVGESLDTTRTTTQKRKMMHVGIYFFPPAVRFLRGKKKSMQYSCSSPRRRTPVAGGRGRGSGAEWSAARERGGWQEDSGDWRPETGALPAAPHRSLSSVTAAGVKAPSLK